MDISMSINDVICVSYRDVAIVAAGVVLSWLAIYLWVTRA
jgi:hypothetical protein